MSTPSLQRFLTALKKHGVDFRMRDELAGPLGLAVDDIVAETFEACAAHLTMRAEQSLPDPLGQVSADVLRAGANEIRMLAREAAK